MKNVMLGHSGDGKTTYVASAYERLQDPVDGFTIRTANDADHRHLRSLAGDIARGRYPPPTAIRSEYEFALHFERKEVLDFTWADYRGGALMDSASAADTARLRADLRECDAIQVFVDAAAVAAGKRVRGQIGRITNFIGEAISRLERPLPLAVILTKCDLVPEEQQNERILEPVRGLMDAVRASKFVLGSVIPVACGPEAQNLELPVLFVLHHGLMVLASKRHDQWKRKYAEFERLSEEVEELEKHIEGLLEQYRKQSILHDIWGAITDDGPLQRAKRAHPTLVAKAQEGAEAADKANRKLRKLRPLIEPAKALGKYLEDLGTF
jgi:hypothetical protein